METINKQELVAIRPAKDSDKNFIYASWLRGLYYGDGFYSEVPKQIFMDNYHKVIEFILDGRETEVRVACLKDDPEIILGYSVLCPDAVHFVFVKKSWRNIGLARDLVPATIKVATHMTKVGHSLIKKKEMTFNPFVIS